MSPFRFRLQALLQLRESDRDTAAAALAAARQAERKLGDEVAALDQRLQQARCELAHAAAPGAIFLERLIDAQRYAGVLAGERARLLEQRTRLSADVDQRREELLAAERQVQTLKKHCQRQHERYLQQQRRQDAKHLDEVAMRNFQTGIAPGSVD